MLGKSDIGREDQYFTFATYLVGAITFSFVFHFCVWVSAHIIESTM